MSKFERNENNISSSFTKMGSGKSRCLLSGRMKERKGGQGDMVKKIISKTADQALDFLKDREEFWNQIQVGSGVSLESKPRVSRSIRK